MALSDTAIRNTKPADKPVKRNNGDGLYLLVRPSGAKWWCFDYLLARKRKTLNMDVYPDVALEQAREMREDARKLVAAGIDPSEHRKASKHEAVSNTLEAVARQ